MMTIKHIVFDIGNVLLHYDPDTLFRRLIPDDTERRWFFENVCTNEWNIEQDRGRPWKQGEALLIETHPYHEENIRAFRRHWHEMVPHFHEAGVAVLRRLVNEGRDVTFLTNFASDTFREAQDRFGFLKLGRGVTVSGDIGLIKPDPAIFQHHQSMFDLEPNATLFIDDNEANIVAARRQGSHSIHLTNPDTIENAIAAFNL